ncbi:tetratricopeptide repeat protein [Granulicella sp. 5B5]|uniref:tetratricopeptide repeat protein n=1 Tax=Granulicella sp. 5B5 TaxID=1617967 RepID=UPI0015F41C52|nr:tetratricopeptide repeat protein [Granulicella sp. 5B5]QMV17309.1 tetratricopeptide repeat protein [Granulicella sp. 5B5]
MTGTLRASFFGLTTAALLGFLSASQAYAQKDTQVKSAATDSAPDRASAYYHYGLAKLYENQAVANGRQDLATQAIEQYKLALDADPTSPALQDGLATLYFRLGRIREAVAAAQDQVTKHPDDVDAHELLGRVYLRSLGDGQGPQANDMLQASIKEYEKIVQLKPKDLETRLLLGQLYGLNHDSTKAEMEFKEAQKIDSTSEEVVLSMARLYSEQGEMEKAADVIAAVPATDRTAREDFALAGIYDTLKKPKDAAAAYQATVDLDPDNTDAKRGLAAALTAAGNMDAASKIYSQILGSDPQDPQALIHQAEIQRQQGEYEKSLATLKTAQSLVAENPEISFNQALDYDALGRYNDSIQILRAILTATANSNGKYSDGELTNRSIFLDRLGIVCREAGRTDEAVDAYKQMAALGGDYQARGTDGQVQAYRDAHEWKQALQVSAQAAKAMPANQDVQLTYASQLADSGKVDDGLKVADAQLKGNADDRDVLFTISDIQIRAKRWKDAAMTLDKAEALASKPEQKVFVYYSRASLDESQKMFDAAEVELRKGLAIEPDNAALENYLGYLFAERGVHLDEAVTMLKKAVAFDPQNGAYLDSLSWAYFKQGQYALAEDYSRRAKLRLGNDPAVLDHLGEIDAKNGKLQQAIDEWQKSLQSYSTSLAPEADPADVAKVQRKLETARVRLAHANPGPSSTAKP